MRGGGCKGADCQAKAGDLFYPKYQYIDKGSRNFGHIKKRIDSDHKGKENVNERKTKKQFYRN